VGPDVDRGTVVEQTLHDFGIIPGDRYVKRRKAAPVGKIGIDARFEEHFGNTEFSVTDSIDESRVVIDLVSHVNFRAMAYQDRCRFDVVVGGGHMKGGDVLAVDVRVCTGFEKDR
jgi:hypothetical protein